MEYQVRDLEVLGIEKIQDGFSKTDGRPWKMVTINVDPDTNQIDDFAFAGKVTAFDRNGNAANLQPGDKITGKVVQKGAYWNFEFPRQPYGQQQSQQNSANVVTKEEFKALETRVGKLEALQFSKVALEPKTDPTDDLPF